jgi:hypothetical protein
MTAPSDASRRPRDAGLFTVMRRAGPRNVSVPSAQSRYARVPTNSQSRSLIRNRRVLYQLLCAVSTRPHRFNNEKARWIHGRTTCPAIFPTTRGS